nr:hypothetical protein [Pontibacter virosus]
MLVLIGHQEESVKGYFAFILDELSKTSFQNKGAYLDLKYFEVSSRALTMIYRILYCTICLLIIHYYFGASKITKIAILLYLFLFVLTLGMYVCAEQSELSQLHTVAFRIDTLLVSPMPIIILIPALSLIPAVKE